MDKADHDNKLGALVNDKHTYTKILHETQHQNVHINKQQTAYTIKKIKGTQQRFPRKNKEFRFPFSSEKNLGSKMRTITLQKIVGNLSDKFRNNGMVI